MFIVEGFGYGSRLGNSYEKQILKFGNDEDPILLYLI